MRAIWPDYYRVMITYLSLIIGELVLSPPALSQQSGKTLCNLIRPDNDSADKNLLSLSYGYSVSPPAEDKLIGLKSEERPHPWHGRKQNDSAQSSEQGRSAKEKGKYYMMYSASRTNVPIDDTPKCCDTSSDDTRERERWWTIERKETLPTSICWLVIWRTNGKMNNRWWCPSKILSDIIGNQKESSTW